MNDSTELPEYLNTGKIIFEQYPHIGEIIRVMQHNQTILVQSINQNRMILQKVSEILTADQKDVLNQSFKDVLDKQIQIFMGVENKDTLWREKMLRDSIMQKKQQKADEESFLESSQSSQSSKSSQSLSQSSS